MDLQTCIQNSLKEAREKTLANSDQLTLGEMISKLDAIEQRNEEPEVVYDFGYLFPTEIDSWRGSYDELALNYKSEGEKMKLSEFLSMLKNAVGKEYTGYKGGEFIMTENTPVWVSNYGEACDTAVIDIVDDEWRVIIITALREF
jgi:hypothetical protein